jgi:Ribonuclease D
MGLNNFRDRLCVVQLSDGNGDAHLVHFPEPKFEAPRLKALLNEPDRVKLFHFARFDVAIIKHYLQVDISPVYCTKIASKLCRTFTDRHSFKELCKELLGQEISKQQQSSNWGAAQLTEAQIDYAAADVLYLHALREKLNAMLEREGRLELAQRAMDVVPLRAELDLAGWIDTDIWSHSS